MKFPLFYHMNEEIQSRKIQNNIYIFWISCAHFSAEFPCSQDKRVGISKKFLLFSTLFLYIPCLYVDILLLVPFFYKKKLILASCQYQLSTFYVNAYRILNLKSIINIQSAIATFFNKSKTLTFFREYAEHLWLIHILSKTTKGRIMYKWIAAESELYLSWCAHCWPSQTKCYSTVHFWSTIHFQLQFTCT